MGQQSHHRPFRTTIRWLAGGLGMLLIAAAAFSAPTATPAPPPLSSQQLFTASATDDAHTDAPKNSDGNDDTNGDKDAADNDWAELEAIDRALRVNTGKLTFIDPPAKPTPLMENNIHLSEESLKTGWARMQQCHEGLDAVPAAQIVYNPNRIRATHITAHRNIGKVWVDGATVQMTDIDHHARICIAAQTRVVTPGKNADEFIVRNGPFMRQFLDGFYPMHVRLNISWPTGLLVLVGTDPVAQKGFSVKTRPGAVHIEAWFEGRLHTQVRLHRRAAEQK